MSFLWMIQTTIFGTALLLYPFRQTASSMSRGYLNVPPEVIPATLKKTTRPRGALPGGPGLGGDRRFEKREEPRGDFRPEFRGAGLGPDGDGYQEYCVHPPTGGRCGLGRGGPLL
mmetsp:Transcript_18396/g.38502  ORF Transcript_18396/g.38502 Transcript_18396/m.38502 type:complete len:115 (+) Transcript_18396:280-624(+)